MQMDLSMLQLVYSHPNVVQVQPRQGHHPELAPWVKWTSKPELYTTNCRSVLEQVAKGLPTWERPPLQTLALLLQNAGTP